MKNKLIFSGVAVAGVLALIFGSFMPYLKASAYIRLIQGLSADSQTSVADLEAGVKKVFDQYSPVGQEEVVKFMSNDFSGFVGQQDEPVARELVRFIDPYFLPDNMIHQLTRGGLYGTLWERFKDENDYKKAIAIFHQAETVGPNVPLPLYNQFNLFLEKGDASLAKILGEKILSLWPQDNRVRGILQK